jgi:hypothetical protein
VAGGIEEEIGSACEAGQRIRNIIKPPKTEKSYSVLLITLHDHSLEER